MGGFNKTEKNLAKLKGIYKIYLDPRGANLFQLLLN
ncbi:MAG: hypothetical protein FD143_3768, partial [Ignavibacteria bacterium]